MNDRATAPFDPNLPSGLFDRVSALLSIVSKIPDHMSDQEVEGLLRFLPEDTARSIGAMLLPRLREPSISFLKMVDGWVHNAATAADLGKKVFIVPFNFPPELIHAFDNAEPITSEVLSTLGVVALEGQGERYWDMAMGLGLPDHMCSSNTIELGSMLGSTDFRPSAIISAAPGGCDVNAKIHEFVSHYLDIPQFTLPKVPDDTGRGLDEYTIYMKRLITGLEDFIGEKLTENKLRAVLEKANRCTELHYELWDLHKARPCPVPNLFSLYLYGTRFTTWGTDAGIKNMEVMVNHAKARLAQKAYPAQKEIARCLWCYTSYYYDFANFFNWMEENGYSHLGDGLDLYFPQIIDTSSMETMVRGLAETAWNMPMTRQVGAQSMSQSWTDDVVHAAKEMDADCVIYCGHHSCKQTWSVVSILREEVMRRTGLQTLILQGDSWIKTMTPMEVIQREIREFVENVVIKKKHPRRNLRTRGKKGVKPPLKNSTEE